MTVVISSAVTPEHLHRPLPCVYRAYKLQSSQELRCDLRGRLLECSLFSLWRNGFLSYRVLATSRTKWYAKKEKNLSHADS